MLARACGAVGSGVRRGGRGRRVSGRDRGDRRALEARASGSGSFSLAAGRRVPARPRAESRRGGTLAAATSSSSTATAFRVVTSSPQSVAGPFRAGFWPAPGSSSASDCRSRSCGTGCRSGDGAPQASSPGRERDIQGWRHLTPRDRRRAWRPRSSGLRAARERVRILHGRRPSDFEAVNGFDARFVGWGDQESTSRLGSGGSVCVAATRGRGRHCSICGIPRRARRSTDLVAPPGDDRRVIGSRRSRAIESTFPRRQRCAADTEDTEPVRDDQWPRPSSSRVPPHRGGTHPGGIAMREWVDSSFAPDCCPLTDGLSRAEAKLACVTTSRHVL